LDGDIYIGTRDRVDCFHILSESVGRTTQKGANEGLCRYSDSERDPVLEWLISCVLWTLQYPVKLLLLLHNVVHIFETK